MIRVIIFDFDGTFYSGKHIFDNIEPKVNKNRRKFLPRLTDDEYAFVTKNYPEWEDCIAGRDIVDCIYKIKDENHKLDISTKDFWKWQQDNDYQIIFDDNEIVEEEFIKTVCKKYHSYIVSNSSPSHLQRYMNRIGVEEEWFKEVISNHFEEYDKTKKHYYKDIMKNEGVKAEEVLVVGDSEIADLQPAKLLNMNVLFISSAKELKESLEYFLEK